MSLPSGYKRLEYIESSGTQYIDTGLVINKTDSYEYILDALLTNDLYGGANGYLQFKSSLSGGKRVTIRVSYDGSTHVTTVYVDGVVFSTTDWTSSYSGENVKIGILRMGNAGNAWYASDPQIGKVYSCKIKKNESLVRDFTPCQTSSGEVGLWDDVNAKFYGNAGTGSFIAGPVAEYVKLEYIESTGTQYIDTGFKHNQNTRVKMSAQVTTKPSTHAWLFEGRVNGSSNKGLLLLNGTTWNTDYVNGSEGRHAFTSIGVLDHLEIDYDKNGVSINGQSHAYTAATFQSTVSLVFFACNTAGSIANYISARIWKAQIYDNGTLVRDYIPVQRVDGTVGLLDQVNYVFYPDAAGGNFVAAPVVPDVPAADPGFFVSLGVTMQATVLAWGATTPGQSFRLYRNGALIYEGPGTYYTDSGLISDVTYSYRMAGFNGSEESTGLSLDIRTRDAVWLITDRTDRDTGDKGHYNCVDLIRVNEALDYVAELLRGAGYIVSVNTRKDWSMNDIPTVAQMEAYIQSIQNIKNTMEYLSTTPQPPRTMNRLTWQQANDIEQLLVDAEYTIFHIHEGLKRTGQFDAWCGPGPRFATAKHDDGRTWEELDAMETEWSGWDAATWYSLLYGHVRGEVS